MVLPPRTRYRPTLLVLPRRGRARACGCNGIDANGQSAFAQRRHACSALDRRRTRRMACTSGRHGGFAPRRAARSCGQRNTSSHRAGSGRRPLARSVARHAFSRHVCRNHGCRRGPANGYGKRANAGAGFAPGDADADGTQHGLAAEAVARRLRCVGACRTKWQRCVPARRRAPQGADAAGSLADEETATHRRRYRNAAVGAAGNRHRQAGTGSDVRTRRRRRARDRKFRRAGRADGASAGGPAATQRA